jgi:hypothetical protein
VLRFTIPYLCFPWLEMATDCVDFLQDRHRSGQNHAKVEREVELGRCTTALLCWILT